MENKDVIKIQVPRETLIKGKLWGKYRSDLDEERSYSDMDRYYILHIYECEISEGTPYAEDHFDNREKLNPNIRLAQPVKLVLVLNEEEKRFLVTFGSYEIDNPVLFDVIQESKQAFGTITADIKGIVQDYKQIEVPVEPEERTGATETRFEDNTWYSRDEYVHEHQGERIRYYGNWYKTAVPPTARALSGNVNNTGYSAESALRSVSFRRRMMWLSFYALGALFVLAAFSWIWPFLLLGLLVWGAFRLARRFPGIRHSFRTGMSFLGTLLYGLFSLAAGLFWFMVLYNLFTATGCRSADAAGTETKTAVENHPPPRRDDTGQLPRLKTKPQTRTAKKRKATHTTSPTEEEQTWITHPLEWRDYNGGEYAEIFATLRTSRAAALQHRNTILPELVSPDHYWNSIYYQLALKDDPDLDSVYGMLNQFSNRDARAFADIIVSAVQYMPYALLLEGECKASRYNQPFITQYLKEGGRCRCCSRFGLYSPVEFAANFEGDCDTRTLLLFTLLTHFGYDAIILNSDVHGHSILGVNLPSHGVYKIHNGKKYFVWETTARGMELGQFPPALCDMNVWYVALTNNN